MTSRRGDALLHPVRLRIVQALLRRPLTAGQLQRTLGDVAQATLYRHIAALEASGLIEVVETRQARGGTERTFSVVEEAATLGAEDLEDAAVEDHLRWFTIFVGTLLADAAAYFDGEEVDLTRDRAGYRQTPLWLTDAETDELVEELRGAVAPRLELPPAPGRRRRLLSTVLLPDDRPDHPAPPDRPER